MSYRYYQYSEMNVSIAHYKNYRFESIFKPKFCKENIRLKRGQVFYSDLLDLLSNACECKNYLNWDEVLQIKQFEAPKPKLGGLLPKPQKPQEPIYDNLEPDPLALKISQKPPYSKPNIKLQFLRNSLPRMEAVIKNLIIYVYKLLSMWEQRQKEIEIAKTRNKKYKLYQHDLEHYDKAYKAWKSKRDDFDKKLKEPLAFWYSEKEKFDSSAQLEHEKLIKLKSNYEKKDKSAIEEVVKTILLRSPYPAPFPRCIEVNYDVESKIMIIEYQLPDFERLEIVEDGKRIDLKKIAQYKRKSIIESSLSAIAIRSLYEVVMTDACAVISSVVFNGWVNFIDKANGNEKIEYILSVHATKNEIKKLIIKNIDAKECFKSLKGIVAKNILEYIPIAPILMINKNDNRLIEGREVIEGLLPESNLAAMDWNDFEHLIRELFEKEFSKSGAEVRITHANHDRGVDAIIYDPDPIRGGKFVVQAKRYTKLVDVSAVRDLYGTIQNENANRGILVTTSHYGPDAYEFAKNKNITLLTGENLLHLLGKHGYKFRIDIKEARKLLNLK